MSRNVVARVAAVVICGVVGVGAAEALQAEAGSGKRALKTRIELSSVLLNSSGQYEVLGKLNSKSPACRFRRTLRLHVVHVDNSVTVVDTDKTKSGVGLFAVRAFLAPREGVFVSSPAREVTLKSGKRLHCATGRTTPVYPTPP